MGAEPLWPMPGAGALLLECMLHHNLGNGRCHNTTHCPRCECDFPQGAWRPQLRLHSRQVDRRASPFRECLIFELITRISIPRLNPMVLYRMPHRRNPQLGGPQRDSNSQSPTYLAGMVPVRESYVAFQHAAQTSLSCACVNISRILPTTGPHGLIAELRRRCRLLNWHLVGIGKCVTLEFSRPGSNNRRTVFGYFLRQSCTPDIRTHGLYSGHPRPP